MPRARAYPRYLIDNIDLDNVLVPSSYCFYFDITTILIKTLLIMTLLITLINATLLIMGSTFN